MAGGHQCLDVSQFVSQSMQRNGRASGRKVRLGNQLNSRFLSSFLGFAPIQKLLGRTEM